MPVILLRHTRPAVASGICYGTSDINVADSFDQDAQAVLQSLPVPDRIVTSPLVRCRRLADYIAQELSLSVVTDTRLQEMDFGTWEGRAWADIPRAEVDIWAADFLHARPHGGESVAMLKTRTQEVLSELENTRDHVLIVTHAGVIRSALATDDTAAAYAATIGFGCFVTLIPPFPRTPS